MPTTRGESLDDWIIQAHRYVAFDVNDIPQLLDRPDTTVAVIGATDRHSKYGSIIYRDLKSKGFKVFAVNPYRDTVDGDPCYRSVADLPKPPTIVDFVVPPKRTLEVLQQCKELGFMTAWVQPGAEDEAVLDYLEAEGFTYLANACIMVRARSFT